MSTTTYAVTVSNPGSGNKYYIDSVLTPTLNLQEGQTYKFDQSDSSNSGHPLRLSTTSDGTHGGGSAYTTGVITSGTPGNSGAFTQITVAADAPNLYYYCSSHSGMGGAATTPTPIGGWGRGTLGSGPWGQPDAIAVTGVTATGAVGTATAIGGSVITVTGVSATGAVGDTAESEGTGVTISLSGVEINITSGNVTATAGTGISFDLTGIETTTGIGTVNIWGEIIPTQDASWSAISISQDAGWTDIAA